MERSKHILVLRLGAMGDILFTTPALRGLKAKYPGCHITYVCMDKWTFLFRNNPNVDRVAGLRYRDPKALGGLLKETFDLVVNLHELEDGARLCQALSASERLGHQWIDGSIQADEESELLVRDTETLKRLYREGLHYPELYCRIARVDVEDYRYDFDPGPWPRWRAARWLAKRGLDGEGFIALHTHSRGMDSKTWPADEVTKVTRALSDQRFVVIGYQPDREVTRTLEDEPNVEVSFAPIRVQAGVMEKARLFVGIDSGPRQIAAALGTQALCLFGPRPPEHLPEFPGDRNLMVDCPHFPCYGDPCPQGEQCMRRLDSDLIVENINEMLQECSDA